MDEELLVLISIWRSKIKTTRLYLEEIARLDVTGANDRLNKALLDRGMSWEEIKELLHT